MIIDSTWSVFAHKLFHPAPASFCAAVGGLEQLQPHCKGGVLPGHFQALGFTVEFCWVGPKHLCDI